MEVKLKDVASGGIHNGPPSAEPQNGTDEPTQTEATAGLPARLGMWLMADHGTSILQRADPNGEAGKGWLGKAKVSSLMCHPPTLSSSK